MNHKREKGKTERKTERGERERKRGEREINREKGERQSEGKGLINKNHYIINWSFCKITLWKFTFEDVLESNYEDYIKTVKTKQKNKTIF